MGPTIDELNKILEIKNNIKQSIINKGVEITDNTKFADYPSKIDNISDNYDNGYNAGLDEGYNNGYSDGYGTGYEEGSANGGDPYYEEFYNLRTSNGINMNSMFARTSGILDLRRLDVSNVTNMKYMFDNSSASVNIDGWDTSNVIDMGYMFYYFTGSIDASKLDASNVINVKYMFNYANTDNIILTGMSFPSTKSLSYMFDNGRGTTLDLSSWDISNITNISYIFNNTNYKKVDLTGWKTTNVTDMTRMFYKSNSPLEELIIPDWDMTNYSGSSIFNSVHMKNLKLIDLSRSNDATITKIVSYLPTRTATTSGTVLVPANTSQEICDTLAAKYWTAQKAGDIPLYVPGEFQYNTTITEVRTMVDESHSSLSNMFARCFNIVSINTEDWDTSNVTNMNSTFYGCSSLPSLDVSNFDTGKVTDMSMMFFGCSSLTSLDLSNWDTGKVTDMSMMFSGCTSLHTLRLDNWSNANISKIITSSDFPTNDIDGVARNIYCKQSESYDRGLLPPEGWHFQCVDTGNIITSGGSII